MGAWRSSEFCDMNIEDAKDFQPHALITMPKPKTKIVRTFTINSTFQNIVKKYMDLRPSHDNQSIRSKLSQIQNVEKQFYNEKAI